MRGIKKGFTWKKSVIIAAAATMVLGTTAFAAGKITMLYSSSSAEPIYREMPSDEQIKKDLGLEPKLVETFENGFAFGEAHLVNTTMVDDEKNNAGTFKQLDVSYQNGDQKINLYMCDAAVEAELEEESTGDITAYGDTELAYSSYVNKFVPADYEMTEEDKEAEESGDIVFSYGSSEVEVITVQSLSWKEDGVHYMLQTFEEDVTQDDLISMAEELVDAQ